MSVRETDSIYCFRTPAGFFISCSCKQLWSPMG